MPSGTLCSAMAAAITRPARNSPLRGWRPSRCSCRWLAWVSSSRESAVRGWFSSMCATSWFVVLSIRALSRAMSTKPTLTPQTTSQTLAEGPLVFSASVSRSKQTTAVITPAAKESRRLTVLSESFRNRQATAPPSPVPPTPARAVIPTRSQIECMCKPHFFFGKGPGAARFGRK